MNLSTEPDAEWASMQDELSRKVLTALERRIAQHGEGQINERDLWLATDTILDLIEGLAPREVTNIVYQVRKELDVPAHTILLRDSNGHHRRR